MKRKRKATDTVQLRVWRWLNWNKRADWVCKCANANGYGVPECPDCGMAKPAPPRNRTPTPRTESPTNADQS